MGGRAPVPHCAVREPAEVTIDLAVLSPSGDAPPGDDQGRVARSWFDPPRPGSRRNERGVQMPMHVPLTGGDARRHRHRSPTSVIPPLHESEALSPFREGGPLASVPRVKISRTRGRRRSASWSPCPPQSNRVLTPPTRIDSGVIGVRERRAMKREVVWPSSTFGPPGVAPGSVATTRTRSSARPREAADQVPLRRRLVCSANGRRPFRQDGWRALLRIGDCQLAAAAQQGARTGPRPPIGPHDAR